MAHGTETELDGADCDHVLVNAGTVGDLRLALAALAHPRPPAPPQEVDDMITL